MTTRDGTEMDTGRLDGVCESDTLGFRIVCNIEIREVPSFGILLEYTLVTWVGKSLA